MANQTIIVNSGNLFAIAAQYLGDATQWNRIALASGTGIDPVLPTGYLTTLTIPPIDPTAGGGIVDSPIPNLYPDNVYRPFVLGIDGGELLGKDGAPLLAPYDGI